MPFFAFTAFDIIAAAFASIFFADAIRYAVFFQFLADTFDAISPAADYAAG